MSMLLLVGCSGSNPVVSTPDNPPDNPEYGDIGDAQRPGDPEVNPPAGFDKGDSGDHSDQGAEDVCY